MLISSSSTSESRAELGLKRNEFVWWAELSVFEAPSGCLCLLIHQKTFAPQIVGYIMHKFTLQENIKWGWEIQAHECLCRIYAEAKITVSYNSLVNFYFYYRFSPHIAAVMCLTSALNNTLVVSISKNSDDNICKIKLTHFSLVLWTGEWWRRLEHNHIVVLDGKVCKYRKRTFLILQIEFAFYHFFFVCSRWNSDAFLFRLLKHFNLFSLQFFVLREIQALERFLFYLYTMQKSFDSFTNRRNYENRGNF